MERSNESTRDRAVGALVGLAAGDAVGTTVEFQPPGSFEPLTDMVGGGPFGLPVGAWTDDTSMALCLAESIIDRDGMDLVDQLRRYVSWRDDGYFSSIGVCFDIGNTTSTQLSRFVRTGEAVDPRVSQEAAANGSLMRLAPVPIRWWNDVATAAVMAAESSRTTHAAQRPVDACKVLATMTAGLIQGESADAVFSPDFWTGEALHPQIEAIVRGSWIDKEPPAIRGTGFCVDALEAAIWAVAGADDFRSAILRAANLGDDADTTAAIAGILAGARWGHDGIPSAWRDRLVAHDRIVSLALALLPSERSAPWPFDDVLHAWPVEEHVLAGEYPASKADPERTSLELRLLLDAGIRTFVDLTQPADGLDTYLPTLQAIAAQRDLHVTHVPMPIPDGSVRPDDGYDEILRAIDDGTEHGGVYVHCWGGMGRTATVIGCRLVDGGFPAGKALAEIDRLRTATRKTHRPAPETPAQRELIERRARSGSA